MTRRVLPVPCGGSIALLAVAVAVAWPAHADPPDENGSRPGAASAAADMPGLHERPAFLQAGYRPAGFIAFMRRSTSSSAC